MSAVSWCLAMIQTFIYILPSMFSIIRWNVWHWFISCYPQGLPCMPQTMMLPSSCGYEKLAFGRERKGTGVFIPLSTAPRRKNRPRRSTWVDNRNDFHGQSATVASLQELPSPSPILFIDPNHCRNSSVLKRHI